MSLPARLQEWDEYESMKSEDFLANLSQSLGREPEGEFTPDVATHLSLSAGQVESRARRVADDMVSRAGELMDLVEQSATEAAWNVFRTTSTQDAANYIRRVAQDVEARTMLRSTHSVLNTLDIEAAVHGTGIALEVMALDDVKSGAEREASRETLRQQAIVADIGITGVDYVVAETGSCVLLPRKGVSRVISLLPPVHIAVVESGQVLPSLDELFTLRRQEFLNGNLGSYMNLISGPSRSADIEYQLVTGVHGPGEVHMVLLD